MVRAADFLLAFDFRRQIIVDFVYMHMDMNHLVRLGRLLESFSSYHRPDSLHRALLTLAQMSTLR